MKRARTKVLPLDFSRPLRPVTPERARELFAKMRETLARHFAACGKSSAK